MVKPGCGCMARVTLPLASVHTGAVVDHVPSPPPLVLLLARPLAFQKFRVSPVALIRLTCLLPVSVCRVYVPPGVLPRLMPPLLWLSVPP